MEQFYVPLHQGSLSFFEVVQEFKLKTRILFRRIIHIINREGGRDRPCRSGTRQRRVRRPRRKRSVCLRKPKRAGNRRGARGRGRREARRLALARRGGGASGSAEIHSEPPELRERALAAERPREARTGERLVGKRVRGRGWRDDARGRRRRRWTVSLVALTDMPE